MRVVKLTAQFKKSLKRISKSGRFDKNKLGIIIDMLARGEELNALYKDHQLHGKFIGHRECHIQPNMLLLYRIENNNLLLVLVNIGSHSEIL